MISRSNIFKFALAGILIFGIGVVVLNIISYKRRQNDFDLTKKDKPILRSDISIVNKPDFKSNNKPPQLTKENKIDTPIQIYKAVMANETHSNILVRAAGTGNYHILLLHGDKSSSKVWETIGTLAYLSNWGYKAYAIDIPKNGNKSLPVSGDKQAVQWLTKLINTLRLSNVVIISPSISGQLTLPFIFQLTDQQQLIRGYVPIDPVGTSHYHTDDYKQVKIPTLIVHAEKDDRFRHTPDVLKQIPKSEILLIKDASYAAHYEKPMSFHNGLRQFLYNVYRPIYKKSFVSNTTKIKQ